MEMSSMNSKNFYWKKSGYTKWIFYREDESTAQTFQQQNWKLFLSATWSLLHKLSILEIWLNLKKIGANLILSISQAETSLEQARLFDIETFTFANISLIR